jgi:prevent-host-death family protein
MATKIGVRQLKNEASRILRDVRNNGEEFILTVDGEEIARLTPIAPRGDEAKKLVNRARALEDADKLAHEVALAWSSSKSAAEEVAEGRS